MYLEGKKTWSKEIKNPKGCVRITVVEADNGYVIQKRVEEYGESEDGEPLEYGGKGYKEKTKILISKKNPMEGKDGYKEKSEDDDENDGLLDGIDGIKLMDL